MLTSTSNNQKESKTKASFFCTSLVVNDLNNNFYHGRTLEFSTDQVVSFLTYYPIGHSFQHASPDGKLGLPYTNKYNLLTVTVPIGDKTSNDALEGVNEAGLSFSLNMKQDSELDALDPSQYATSLPVAAIGEWAIANFSTVEEVKEGIKSINPWSQPLEMIGGLKSPFHFAIYDRAGGAIVVEVSGGKLHVYDNPTGVMTNGPEFPWHLTNLNNYTHVNNIDVSMSKVGKMTLVQPDSGIAAAALPSSSTSVGRFVKAFFYANFINKVADADKQIVELAHVMNNFDRPKNITKDQTGEGEVATVQKYMTEFTVWTALTDLTRGFLYIRSYADLNYTQYTFEQFKNQKEVVNIPLYK